jgi:peptidoglycan glycosyltransferase
VSGERHGDRHADRAAAPGGASGVGWAGRRAGIGDALGRVALGLAICFGLLAGGAGYWQVIRASDLSRAPDDAAVIAASRSTLRGAITDRDGNALATSQRDANGETYRVYASPALSGVLGYASLQFGNSGLERAWDAQLSGVASEDPLYDLTRKFRADPSDPQAIQSTLVLSLQEAAVAALGDNRGAVVMLNPTTGEVLALASTPVFDASAVANPATSADTFQALQADASLPLLPRATLGRYVPGSIFKIVTSMAALGSGAITVDTSYPEQPPAETDGLLVSGFRVRDGHHPATGDKQLTYPEAVEVSCNIYFALTGLKTGGATLVEYADRVGFDAPIPFDLPTAVSQVTGGGGSFGGGFLDDVELANAAYGQAETLVTPLQMALVAATVANGGVLMKPHLMLSATGHSGTRTIGPETLRQVIPGDVAAEITSAMQLAVEGKLGRQFTAGAQVDGLPVAGKTGTAQLDPGLNPHSWFIGFAPADHPQIALAVIVEQGGHGSDRAAPIAGELFRAWQAWAGG